MAEEWIGTHQERFDRGERTVVGAMKYWARLTDRFRACLEDGNADEIGELMDANFDRRRKIYRIGKENIRMIEAARSVGASAKFTGSGGAIVGTYRDAKMFEALKRALAKVKAKVIKPRPARGAG